MNENALSIARHILESYGDDGIADLTANGNILITTADTHTYLVSVVEL